MAKTYRVYYTGKGETIDASEDGGKTWKKFTKCKTVDHGSKTMVWAPPGFMAVRRNLTLKIPVEDVHGRHLGFTVRKGQSVYVAGNEEGPEDSFQDLTRQQYAVAMNSANQEGLVDERDYFKELTAAQLKKRAEKYAKMAAELESEGVQEEINKGPGRPRKSV